MNSYSSSSDECAAEDRSRGALGGFTNVHLEVFGIEEEKEQQNPIGQLPLLLFAADIISARAIRDGSEGCTVLHLDEACTVLVRASKQCMHTVKEHFLQVAYLTSPCLCGSDCSTFLVDSCCTVSGEQQIQPGDHIDPKIQKNYFPDSDST